MIPTLYIPDTYLIYTSQIGTSEVGLRYLSGICQKQIYLTEMPFCKGVSGILGRSRPTFGDVQEVQELQVLFPFHFIYARMKEYSNGYDRIRLRRIAEVRKKPK